MSPDDRIVEAKIWNRKTKVYDSRMGAFHGFGVDFEEFESGPAPFSIALVELPDGTVEMPRADRIRFLLPTLKA
jgi:hypothetical protein